MSWFFESGGQSIGASALALLSILISEEIWSHVLKQALDQMPCILFSGPVTLSKPLSLGLSTSQVVSG